jgi:hypothetical protein
MVRRLPAYAYRSNKFRWLKFNQTQISKYQISPNKKQNRYLDERPA